MLSKNNHTWKPVKAHQKVTGQQEMQSSETMVSKQLRIMFVS